MKIFPRSVPPELCPIRKNNTPNSIKFDIRSNLVEFCIEFTNIYIIESNQIELLVNSIRFGSIGALPAITLIYNPCFVFWPIRTLAYISSLLIFGYYHIK